MTAFEKLMIAAGFAVMLYGIVWLVIHAMAATDQTDRKHDQ
jgi:hypothetical protein